MRGLVLLLAGLLSAPAAATDYRLFQQNRPAGLMVVNVDGQRRTISVEPEGSRQARSKTEVELDRRGHLAGMDYRGIDSAGGRQVERLTVSGGRAQWETGIDKGESAASGYYVPLSLNAEQLAILARALLAAPGKRLALLPSGEAGIEKADQVTLPSGAGPVVADLYLISGLGRRPLPVWLDSHRELLARVSVIEGSTVRVDVEGARDTLLERQERRIAAGEEALARDAVERPTTPVLIRNANLYDSKAAVMRPGTDVLIEGERITAVGRNLRVPPRARRIDAGGRALLPGLWDAHVHMFDPGEALIMVANGVTSARDMGNSDAATQGWRRRFDAGELIGPRLLLAAVVDGPGQRDIPWAKEVKTEAEVDALVAKLAAEGFSTVKLFNALPPPLATRLISQAHDRGLLVGGHLPFGWMMDQAISAGIDESTHFDFVLLNFLPPLARENYPAMKRLSFIVDGLQQFDLGQPAVAATIAAMLKGQVSLDPTLAGYEGLLRDKAGKPASYLAPYAERVTSRQLRYSLGGGVAKSAEEATRNERALQSSLRLLGRFAKAGVPLVAGGDGEPALMIPRELELYVEAGLTPLQALQAATINPARTLRRDKDLGSIEVGKLADLVLVEGDPARDVGVVRQPVLVMKGGAIYDLSVLNPAVGMRPSPALARFRQQTGRR